MPKWTHDWGLQINQVKTHSTVFSLSTTKEQVKINLDDIILPQTETPIFLGATLDSRLSLKPQIKSMRKRGIQKLSLLKLLSGTHWGTSPRILKTVYTGTVRPTLECGARAWAIAAKTHTNKLDKVQNMGLRTILGAMKSTSIATMQKTAGVKPLDSRMNAMLLTQGEKVNRIPDYPLHKRLQDMTKNRLTKPPPCIERAAEETIWHPSTKIRRVWNT